MMTENSEIVSISVKCEPKDFLTNNEISENFGEYNLDHTTTTTVKIENFDIEIKTEPIEPEIHEPSLNGGLNSEEFKHLVWDPLHVDSEIKEEKNIFTKDDVKNVKNEKDFLEEGSSREIFVEDGYIQKRGTGNFKPNMLKCETCGRTYRYNSDLKRHLLSHENRLDFFCEHCGKGFKRKSNLDLHILVHTDKKPHICTICKKSFRFLSNLNEHNLIHTGHKPHTCNICKKEFRVKSSLTKHQRIHTGIKPYICDICGNAFTQKPHLDDHKRHHMGIKPHQCTICQKSFAQKSGLKKHLIQLHNFN